MSNKELTPLQRERLAAVVLAEKHRKLRKVMREMLDCYWGRGDGDTPPEFITRAANLSGWKFP